MITSVCIGGETWYLIEDYDQFARRWLKARRRRFRFFEVRYAGRRMYVNADAITCAFNFDIGRIP